ncbi:MAG: hypothetical protein JWP10_635 [Nocardioidaceae bacterium]|nr:hypothetical protein [Nocardioidaceae bacterium]
MRHAGYMKLRLFTTLTAALLLVAACGGSSDDKTETKPEVTAATTTPAPPVIVTSPLTGLEMPDGRPTHPVYVAKVDNTGPAAPQIGLDKADVVVQELVEGGVTRLAVLFYSNTPTKVGHIRSMRATDIGIAKPVKAQIIASGGARPTIRRVARANVTVHLEDAQSPGFSGDVGSRPYNRLINIQKLADLSKPVVITRNYFTFGKGIDGIVGKTLATTATGATQAAPVKLSKTVSTAKTRFSGGSVTTWGLKDGKWKRTSGPRQSSTGFLADTMIVIQAKVQAAGYNDVAGNPVPETILQGTGKAVIFQGSEALKVIWTKDKLNSTLSFKTADGQAIGIKPGKTWIELIPDRGGKLTF